MSAIGATGNADAVAAGVQKLLAEQLAKQLLASTKPQDGSPDPTAVYSDQLASVLADAITKAPK